MIFWDWIKKQYDIFAEGKSRQEGSYSAFAREIKLKPGTVSSWLRREKKPKELASFVALIKYYGTEQLLGIEDLELPDEVILLIPEGKHQTRFMKNFMSTQKIAITLVNKEFEERGIDADTAEAEHITKAIFERCGIRYTSTTYSPEEK